MPLTVAARRRLDDALLPSARGSGGARLLCSALPLCWAARRALTLLATASTRLRALSLSAAGGASPLVSRCPGSVVDSALAWASLMTVCGCRVA